jgi:hypothetical protein
VECPGHGRRACCNGLCGIAGAGQCLRGGVNGLKPTEQDVIQSRDMTAATTLIPSITPTCTTPCGTTVGVGLATTGRLSAVKVSWRAVSMAVTTAGSPPAAAGTMLSRPTTPTSNAFSALGATIVPSLMMAGVAAASATPVTDAAAAPIALSRSPDCKGRDERARCLQDGNGHGHRALYEDRAVDELITQEACEATAPEVPEPEVRRPARRCPRRRSRWLRSR